MTRDPVSHRTPLLFTIMTGLAISALAFSAPPDAMYRPGRYQTVWDGMNEHGHAPAGLYFVRYEWPGQHSVKRLLLVP